MKDTLDMIEEHINNIEINDDQIFKSRKGAKKNEMILKILEELDDEGYEFFETFRKLFEVGVFPLKKNETYIFKNSILEKYSKTVK